MARPHRAAKRTATVRIGTSGWVYPHWRGVFYPRGLPSRRWLEHYSSRFETVEINNTFYRLPPEETFLHWREAAPKGFVYALKANRYLTHVKKLKSPEEPLETMLQRFRLLGGRLGPILYQLPPHWRRNVERLRAFVRLLPSRLDHVVEFRDPSWRHEDVRRVLVEAGVSFCIHDMPGSRCPQWVTGPIVYLRFHGPTPEAYAGCYSRRQLRRWAERIGAFRDAGRDVYAYFNNDVAGHAVANAQQLRELVAA